MLILLSCFDIYWSVREQKLLIIDYVVQVGTNGAEGYCVNVPWSCGGVGDKDYIYAFQHVVLPIGTDSCSALPFWVCFNSRLYKIFGFHKLGFGLVDY